MAYLKIIQNIGEFAVSGTSIESNPIALKSGYLRIANGPLMTHVAIGTGGAATESDFAIPANNSEIIKERVGSQAIAGITTGAETIIISPEGGSHPYDVDDYVSITGVSPTGINTNWARVVSVLDRRLVLDWNTSNVVGPFTFNGAETRRSVKLALSGAHGASYAQVSEVQIAGG